NSPTGGERPAAWSRAVAWIFMIAVGVYVLLPVYWLIVASTKSTGDLFSTPGIWFAENNFWQNIVDLTQRDNGIFWRWLLNTVIYSGLGSVLMTFISLLAGYTLAVYRFKGRKAVIGVVMGSMLVPITV